jgi:hypothetical protein
MHNILLRDSRLLPFSKLDFYANTSVRTGVQEHASLRMNILGECSWCVLLALSYLFFETIRVPDHMAAPKENAPLSEQE